VEICDSFKVAQVETKPTESPSSIRDDITPLFFINILPMKFFLIRKISVSTKVQSKWKPPKVFYLLKSEHE